MNDHPHKPVSMPSWRLEASESDEEALWRIHPERKMAIAHETAALLIRAEEGSRPEMLERVTEFVDVEGIETLAELWAGTNPISLPHALFRLFQVREQIHLHPEEIGHLINSGIDILETIDPYVFGAQVPVTAETVQSIVDQILSGSFQGDLAQALERAASLATLVSAGLLNWLENGEGARHAHSLSALAWGDVAKELANCAVRERKGLLA